MFRSPRSSKTPSAKAPVPRGRVMRAGRRAVVMLAEDLGSPSSPGRPLFGGVRSRWLRLLPYVIALGFATTLLPVTITVLLNDYGINGGLAGALGVAQAAPLLMIVTRPLQAWWVIFAADVVGGFALINAPGLDGRAWPWTPMGIVGYLLLMLAIGLREPRRTLIAVWLATGAAGLVFELVYQSRNPTHLLLFILSGLILVVGGALRERGDAQRKLVEQETISEAERSRRTLLEERARIARELHDVVAHHMSVITVQADSAPYRIGGLPKEAEEEFGTIAATARESLAEMRRLLGVLRNEETERARQADGPEKSPQPGLAQLPKLVEGTVRAGVPVELSLTRAVEEPPQAVDLSAYRIVQEALANVVRHAPGAQTRVSVTTDRTSLTVLIVNGPPPQERAPLETSGTGHGLVGMRERVRLVGGTLDTGPLPDGGFRVAARLPLTAKDSDPA